MCREVGSSSSDASAITISRAIPSEGTSSNGLCDVASILEEWYPPKSSAVDVDNSGICKSVKFFL